MTIQSLTQCRCSPREIEKVTFRLAVAECDDDHNRQPDSHQTKQVIDNNLKPHFEARHKTLKVAGIAKMRNHEDSGSFQAKFAKLTKEGVPDNAKALPDNPTTLRQVRVQVSYDGVKRHL